MSTLSCNLGNWKQESENVVNEQILVEYWASLQYHLMWSYFDSSSVGLENIANFFKKSSDEEREHAHNFMKYQNLRGGKVKLTKLDNVDLSYLDIVDINDVLSSFKKALDMEQKVYKSLLKVHKVSEEQNDPQFSDFVESEYLEEQVTAINEITKYIAKLERIGENTHGIYHFNENFKEI